MTPDCPRRRRTACAVAVCLLLTAGCGWFRTKRKDDSVPRLEYDDFETAYRMVLEGHCEEAVPGLTALAERRASARRPDAMFWLAYAYAEQGLNLEARAWYRRYLEKYPDHRYAPAARDRLKELDGKTFRP